MRSVLWISMVIGVAMVTEASQSQAEGASDKAEIQALAQSQSEAWNRGDAEAFGAHYAEDGSFANILGQQLYGRKVFIQQHAVIFSTIYKGTRNTRELATRFR